MSDKEEKIVFLVEYKCKDASPGRNIVVAYNLMDAQKLFFKRWKSGYEAGEFAVPPEDLESINFQPWCPYWEMIGRY